MIFAIPSTVFIVTSDFMLKIKQAKQSIPAILGAFATAAMLAGCGSDSTPSEPNTASFSLAVSDAPVDAAEEVWACFHSVELVGHSAGKQEFRIGDSTNAIEANDVCVDANGDVIANTRGINLLEFTGSDSENLLSGAEVPAGSYGQLRLAMAEGSYVMVAGERIPLSVPSNELKFDGITLDAGSNHAYTVEFDLRHALVNPVGQQGYLLKPRGVRLVDDMTVGHIQGSIAEALLIENQCTVAPADTSTAVAVVYFYPGSDIEITAMADFGGAEAVEPYTAAAVYFDGATQYEFTLGFVATGDYTAAWSCDTNDDSDIDDELVFIASKNISVGAEGEVVVVNFE